MTLYSRERGKARLRAGRFLASYRVSFTQRLVLGQKAFDVAHERIEIDQPDAFGIPALLDVGIFEQPAPHRSVQNVSGLTRKPG